MNGLVYLLALQAAVTGCAYPAGYYRAKAKVSRNLVDAWSELRDIYLAGGRPTIDDIVRVFSGDRIQGP